MKPNFTRVKSFFLPVIYFVFTCFLVAQDYNGVVLDKVTNQPLESVSVYLDGTTIGVVTNAKGGPSIRYLSIDFL